MEQSPLFEMGKGNLTGRSAGEGGKGGKGVRVIVNLTMDIKGMERGRVMGVFGNGRGGGREGEGKGLGEVEVRLT